MSQVRIEGINFPAGIVLPFAGSTEPPGWLFCAGQAVSRTAYARLFGVIGTTYGAGDGSTTFAMPDLRGRIVAGRDDMNGSAANRITAAGSGITGTSLGAAGGTETHTLTEAQMPSHTHTQNSHTHSAPLRSTTTAGDDEPTEGSGGNVGTYVMGSTTATNQSTGGGGAHNNTQPTMVMNYIIRI